MFDSHLLYIFAEENFFNELDVKGMIEILNIKTLQDDNKLIGEILNKLNICSMSIKSSILNLSNLLHTLRDDLIVAIEYEYVDAMYRDEYYRFYATKFHHYARNCARISFFEPGILIPGESVDYTKSKEIIEQYLGFVVVRPIGKCIGRNVISVKAKRKGCDDIAICQAGVHTTALGLKVCVHGFPHSSQDGEMMACAETALWSIAEYYGHKYPRYTPVSPSEILDAMRPSSYQRQLPSRGLTFHQISIGLRTFGFSPEAYQLYVNGSNGMVLDEEMKEVFTCYVESGFPLAICLQGGIIGHAVVCVGRNSDKPKNLKPEVINGRNLLFYNQSVDEFVFNDDNFPCYQKTQLQTPTSYYSDPEWSKVLLTKFIVPLPSKVYMNASIAIQQSKILLGYFAPDNAVVRTYLASCRSFRHHIATSRLMPNENKEIMIRFELPRFIWITEFGTMDEYDNDIASGLIILDATEPNDKSTNSLILAINGNCDVAYNTESLSYENLNLPIGFLMERFYNIINC